MTKIRELLQKIVDLILAYFASEDQEIEFTSCEKIIDDAGVPQKIRLI